MFLQTYNVDHQVADSAGSANALVCGVKTNYATVGLSAHVERGDCRGMQGHELTCIAEMARKAGVYLMVYTGASKRPCEFHTMQNVFKIAPR